MAWVAVFRSAYGPAQLPAVVVPHGLEDSTDANCVLQLPASDGQRELDAAASLSPCRRTMGTFVGGTADPGLGGPRAEVPGPVAGEALGSYPEVANRFMNSGQMRRAFGPVLSVTPCSSEGTALNAARYGLWGAVFQRDVEHALAVAGCLRNGGVDINCAAFNEITLFGPDEFCEINSNQRSA